MQPGRAARSAFCLRSSEWRHSRGGFTLMELLIVMMILAVLAAMSLSALSGAVESAREQRTRSIIAKIDQLIMDKYESYKTRPAPVRINARTPPMSERFVDGNNNNRWDGGESFTDTNNNGMYDRGAAEYRLYAIRELMRLELPDRISDLLTATELTDLQADNDLDAILPNAVALTSLPSMPALARAYKRKAARSINAGKPWTTQFQGSECLYLILSHMKDGDKNAIDFFSTGEIGDTDADGMLEILDGWGNPIEFIRWAPGYLPANGAITMQTDEVDTVIGQRLAPDPFDPLRVDPRYWLNSDPTDDPYALFPLIFSAGADGVYDINAELINASNMAVPAAQRGPYNDPYGFGVGVLIGTTTDANSDGVLSYADNITNHFIEAE